MAEFAVPAETPCEALARYGILIIAFIMGHLFMLVRELIEILKTLPPDHLVVSDGYEDGYDTVVKVKLLKVTETEDKEWYVGRYDYAFNNTNAKEVVYLDADNKNEGGFK